MQSLLENPVSPAQLGTDVEDEPSPRKRKRDALRRSYPRKRALRACDACRKRKIKCDNTRPACGGCADLEIECDWGEEKDRRSTYDFASLEILEKLNYAVSLLEAQRTPASVEAIVHRPTADIVLDLAAEHHHPTPGSLPWSENNPQDDAEIFLESLEISGRSPQVSEDILEWPVFEGEYDRSRIESLIFNPEGTPCSSNRVSSDAIRRWRPGRGIQEEDIPKLVDKFLTNVHIKNPILDPEDIKRKGRWILENGISWDARSCLVLIVCALATISSSFTRQHVTAAMVDPSHNPDSVHGYSEVLEYDTAESYFMAAQKRIGLLENTILGTQCHFLVGVYQMYSLRPLKAWQSFNRACICLQVYLKGHPDRNASKSRGLESRLYWSCLKSECEIRMELNLPSSGLAKVNFPDMFPSPPESGVIVPSDNHTREVSNRPHGPGNHQLQTSDSDIVWAYYISDIAVRKIGNRLMNCFYESDETAWLSMPLNRMMRVAEELDLQISQWFNNLPAALSFNQVHDGPDQLVKEELQFMLEGRLHDFRERIFRPFLYLSLHHPADAPIQEIIAPYVKKSVDACIACLIKGIPRHRHHGTWYENRGAILKSFLVVAALKGRKTVVGGGWPEGLNLAIAGLKFWEAESPDLREARLILENLLAGLTHV